MNNCGYGFSAYTFATKPRIPQPRLVKRVPLLPGDAGVAQTIEEMRSMVRESVADPRWHDIAVKMVPLGAAILGEGAYRQLIESLRYSFRYIRDARGAEQIWTPDVHAGRLVSVGYTWGDCDDATIYAACIAQSMNLGPVRFATIANGRNGHTFNHVYVEVNLNGTWKTLDFLSKIPQPIIRLRVWMI